MSNEIYYAYVQYNDGKGSKKRSVLLLRRSKEGYLILRLTSKYANKSDFFKRKYIKIEDWDKANLPKPSWIDTYQTYLLPITTKLIFIGKLSDRDLIALSHHFKW